MRFLRPVLLCVSTSESTSRSIALWAATSLMLNSLSTVFVFTTGWRSRQCLILFTEESLLVIACTSQRAAAAWMSMTSARPFRIAAKVASATAVTTESVFTARYSVRARK